MTARIGPYELDSIVTGDARELAAALPDESVDLIFTDPPYPRAFENSFSALASTAHALRQGGRMLTLLGHYQLPLVMAELSKVLIYDWIIAQAATGKTAAMFQKRVWAAWKPCLVYRKGTISNRMNFAMDLYKEGGSAFKFAKQFHKWGQGAGFFAYYIDRWTLPGDTILDPFCGGGTVPAVCRMLGRHYLAFEIDPSIASIARERVHNTQPPLFVPEPEQASMFAGAAA